MDIPAVRFPRSPQRYRIASTTGGHYQRSPRTSRCAMQMRRLTRLTNTFSKKWENLWAPRTASTSGGTILFASTRPLRITPAMAAGITDHVWELRELLR